jgi:hypothetical protein
LASSRGIASFKAAGEVVATQGCESLSQTSGAEISWFWKIPELNSAVAPKHSLRVASKPHGSTIAACKLRIARALVPAQFVDMILKFAPRSFESFSNRRCEVVLGLMVDAQLATRKREVDPHIERATPMVMAHSALDDDVTAADAVVKVLEFCDFLPNLGFDRLIQGETTSGDLQIELHVLPSGFSYA